MFFILAFIKLSRLFVGILQLNLRKHFFGSGLNHKISAIPFNINSKFMYTGHNQKPIFRMIKCILLWTNFLTFREYTSNRLN